jgi:hypothetical protein
MTYSWCHHGNGDSGVGAHCGGWDDAVVIAAGRVCLVSANVAWILNLEEAGRGREGMGL